MAVRKKSSAKTKAKRAVQKTKAAVKRTVSRAKAAAKRTTKKKRRAAAPVPEIEPPSAAGATGKSARRVGSPPAATRRRGSPALSIAGGGIAVPRGR